MNPALVAEVEAALPMASLVLKYAAREIGTATRSPLDLAIYAQRGRYITARHIELQNEAALRLADGSLRRLMVQMPPRHGKSEFWSHYVPAWFLGTFPDKRVLHVSYDMGLSRSFGRKTRDTLTEFGPRLFNVAVSEVSAAADEWNLAGVAGGMKSAGIGTAITGRGGDLIVIDDPTKNAEEAQSVTYRERNKDWWDSVLYTRQEPGAAIVIVQTRWDEDDLSGWLEEQAKVSGEEWEILRLPAIAEGDDDLLGRAEGEALWPERFDLEALEAIRRTLTSYWWAALYQQRPAPLEGGLFKRDWFTQRWRDLPPLQLTIQSIDSAWSKVSGASYSVITTWGTDGIKYYVIDEWRSRVEYPDLEAAIKDCYAKHRPQALLIEDAASGKAAIQTLRRTTSLPVIGRRPVGSKEIRAGLVAPLAEAGRVILPDGVAWTGDWIAEHVSFPNAANDDRVDTTSMALAYLREQVELVGVSEEYSGIEGRRVDESVRDPWWEEDHMDDDI